VPVGTELTVSLTAPQPPPYFNVHPCVRTQGGVSLQLMRFVPPTGIFPLCMYSNVKLQSLPIRGFYQLKVFDWPLPHSDPIVGAVCL